VDHGEDTRDELADALKIFENNPGLEFEFTQPYQNARFNE